MILCGARPFILCRSGEVGVELTQVLKKVREELVGIRILVPEPDSVRGTGETEDLRELLETLESSLSVTIRDLEKVLKDLDRPEII